MATCVIKSPNSIEIAQFSKNLQAFPKIYVATMQKITKKRNTLQLDSKVQGFFFNFVAWKIWHDFPNVFQILH
jgi:hypothetical protein